MDRDRYGGGRDLRELAGHAGSRLSARLGNVWWAFMVRGLLAGVLGIAALFWPSGSLDLLIRIVGVYCLADGAAALFGALRAAERGPLLSQALVALAIGLILLLWPGATVRALLMVFGIFALITGISQIMAARQIRAEGSDSGFMMSIGVVAAAVGLILVLWPGTGVVAISWFIAVVALLIAALLIFLAIRLKRVKERLDARSFARSAPDL
jgi:uncharacterized membrane protein HdeD (DUF308 family)